MGRLSTHAHIYTGGQGTPEKMLNIIQLQGNSN